ncbi:hypothetical protein GPECTOR_385g193 [Gonium pectorale]|uniref:Protein kinase domain-containing protein n=1 Tax=Gonium pectorale TaxID=33097 RepID=A0A150FVD0_GONPE|nr:hypothetical protein GPECTOR_385g193 [Gonium pectorale]|eukprot:KXZ41572.1 hypothetical protein GPECTOR_385g193 [Gonium pectorale]
MGSALCCFIALLLALRLPPSSAATSVVTSGADLARAMSNSNIDTALLPVDLALREDDWDGISVPVVVDRNFTVQGIAQREAIIDFGFVRQKFRMGNGTVLTLRRILGVNFRSGSFVQTPGLDLMLPMPTGERAVLRLDQGAVLMRACFPPGVLVQAAQVLTLRPEELPGTNTIVPEPLPPGCVNDTAAPPLDRCYAYSGTYKDIGSYGYDIGQSGSPVRNGYLLHCTDLALLCSSVYDDQCIEKYGPLGCVLYTQSLSPPPPPSPPPNSGPGGSPFAPGGGGGGGGSGVGSGGGGAGAGAPPGSGNAPSPSGAALAAGVGGGVGGRSEVAVKVIRADGGGNVGGAAAAFDGDVDQWEAGPGVPQRPPSAAGVAAGEAASPSGSQHRALPRWRQQLLQLQRLRKHHPAGLPPPPPSAAAALAAPPLTAELRSHHVAKLRGLQPGQKPELHPQQQQQQQEQQQQQRQPQQTNGDPPQAGPSGRILTAAVEGAKCGAGTPEDQASSQHLGPEGTGGGGRAAGPGRDAGAGPEIGPVGSGTSASGAGPPSDPVAAAKAGTAGMADPDRRPASSPVVPRPPSAAEVNVVKRQTKLFASEVAVLGRCDHPNVVRLLAACLTPPRLCLVMERCETSLERLIYGDRGGGGRGEGGAGGGAAAAAAGGGVAGAGGGNSSEGAGAGAGATDGGAGGPSCRVLIPLEKLLHIAIQICQGLEYLHPTIVHRDLKPANVLINGADTDRPVAKLADMYSLGVLLWAMLTGQQPWKGHTVVAVAYKVAVLGERLPLDHLPEGRCPPKLRRLIRQCWETDPRRRPAAAEAAKELHLLRESLTTANRPIPRLWSSAASAPSQGPDSAAAGTSGSSVLAAGGGGGGCGSAVATHGGSVGNFSATGFSEEGGDANGAAAGRAAGAATGGGAAEAGGTARPMPVPGLGLPGGAVSTAKPAPPVP